MALRWRLALVFALATAVVLAIAAVWSCEGACRATWTTSVHSRLQAREAVLARLVLTRSEELRHRPLRPDLLHSPYTPETDEIAQVFSPEGKVVLSNDVKQDRPLLDRAPVRGGPHPPGGVPGRPGLPGKGDLIRASAARDLRRRRVGGGGGRQPGRGGRDPVPARSGFAIGGSAIGIGARRCRGLGAGRVGAAAGGEAAAEAEVISAADGGAALAVPDTSDEVAELARTMNGSWTGCSTHCRSNAGSSPTPGTSCAPRSPCCGRSWSWPTGRRRSLDELRRRSGSLWSRPTVSSTSPSSCCCWPAWTRAATCSTCRRPRCASC